jgi:hypothetical protein
MSRRKEICRFGGFVRFYPRHLKVEQLTAGEPIISLFLYFSAFLLLFITCSPSPLLACSVLPKAKRRGRDSLEPHGSAGQRSAFVNPACCCFTAGVFSSRHKTSLSKVILSTQN